MHGRNDHVQDSSGTNVHTGVQFLVLLTLMDSTEQMLWWRLGLGAYITALGFGSTMSLVVYFAHLVSGTRYHRLWAVSTSGRLTRTALIFEGCCTMYGRGKWRSLACEMGERGDNVICWAHQRCDFGQSRAARAVDTGNKNAREHSVISLHFKQSVRTKNLIYFSQLEWSWPETRLAWCICAGNFGRSWVSRAVDTRNKHTGEHPVCSAH